MELLLVEDDELLGEGVKAGLEQTGYTVSWARDARQAMRIYREQAIDLVVLDLGLPDRDGLEVLSEFRTRSTIPVLVLTARDTVAQRVTGLDHGADDYMTKPFDLDELTARLRALVRRRGGRDATIIELGGLRLDASSYRADLDGVSVTLTQTEFAVLRALVQNAGNVLAREELEAAVRGSTDAIDSNAVEVHIHHLRRKLGKQVNAHLGQLNMAHCQFEIAIIPEETATLRQAGSESIEFRISTVPGQAPAALARVASGGELSRISLATQVVTAQTPQIPTLVFD